VRLDTANNGNKKKTAKLFRGIPQVQAWNSILEENKKTYLPENQIDRFFFNFYFMTLLKIGVCL